MWELLFGGAEAANEQHAPKLIELYSRGSDLVSTHAPSDHFPFRVQTYWSLRPSPSGRSALVVLTLSLQTDLLDTRPSLTLTTSLEADPQLALEGAARCIGDGANWSGCIGVHPLDLPEFTSDETVGATQLVWSPPFLEKGVIRRCQVAAVFCSSPFNESELQEAFQSFINAPAPLTA